MIVFARLAIRAGVAVMAVALFLVSAPQWAGAADANVSLQQLVDEAREQIGSVGLSAAAVLDDGTLIAAASGLADRESGQPLEPTDMVLAGSTGKVLFGAVALQLADEGVLDLDAPIADVLGSNPWFSRLPNGDAITARQLMSHTSGLIDQIAEPGFLQHFSEAFQEDPDYAETHEELGAYMLDHEPLYPAGEGFKYSDGNYIILGLVIETLTGADYYDLIQARIIDRYELRGIFPQRSRDISGLATGHWNPEQNFMSMPSSSNRLEDGSLIYNPAFEWGGGGYAASVTGLAHLAKLLYEDKVVSDARFQEMQVTKPLAETPNFSMHYGLGFMVFEAGGARAVGHAGFFPGYQTLMVYVPEAKTSFAVAINSELPVPLPVIGMNLVNQFLAALAN